MNNKQLSPYMLYHEVTKIGACIWNKIKGTIFRYRNFVRILICLLFVFYAMVAGAAVRLPSIISDNMVLQRGQTVPIWGWANPDEKVTVTICGQARSVQTDTKGKWMVHLDSLSVGGPYTMTVKGENSILLKNILVGEVWLCSGQSNMELRVDESNNATAEISAANYPEIHLLSVPFRGTEEPQKDFKAQWIQCSPKNVGNFSAVAYYFGRELQQKLNIPIGLIHCSWGASSCESWIKRSILDADPKYKPMLQEWNERMATFDLYKAEEAEQLCASWTEQVTEAKNAGKEPPKPPENLNDLHNLMFVVRKCPSYCYNGMLSPLIPYAIRGAIWYQGETNISRAYQYRQLFPLMIRSWRDEWGQGDFPFFFVQLANYMDFKELPGESALAELREAQTMALRTPNTVMAVTIDIGATFIHPTNKQDVGKRLSLLALANVYSKNVVYSGPMYKSMEKKGKQIVLHFDQKGTGLMAKGGEPLKGFAIAGADQKFVWANAHIVDDMVIVSSPDIADPIAVRYAWAENPVCNLYNRESLPASPFRTDSWKGITEK